MDKKSKKKSIFNCEVKDCSNCIYNIENRRCEVMRKLLWNEECFAWASPEEAVKREEAIMDYLLCESAKCKKNIQKYKRRAVAYGRA